MLITPAQVRAGRALLDWTLKDLAQASGVSEKTIQHIEKKDGYTSRPSIQKFIILTFHENKIDLISGGARFKDGRDPSFEDA